MSDILSQSEIESLLSSLQNDPAAAGAAGAAAEGEESDTPGTDTGYALQKKSGNKSAVAYEVYDFRRPDKFSKEQLRTLQMLHESFARMGGTSLSAYLRNPVSIDLISLEQVPFEEYLRSINESVFTIMSLPPLAGQAVLEIEFALVFGMIDRLLGGPGRSIERQMLTDIEKPLVRQVLERLFNALKGAWEGVVIVNPGVESMETSSQFVQIAPPSDIVVTILFEIKVGNQRGAMSLCIPYLVLKPITAKLSAQKWFVSGIRKPSASNRRSLTHQIQQTQVDLCIILGSSKITVRDFLHLQAGDIVRLNQRADGELPVLVAGSPKFEGKPALNGKKLAFTVTNLYES